MTLRDEIRKILKEHGHLFTGGGRVIDRIMAACRQRMMELDELDETGRFGPLEPYKRKEHRKRG